MKKKSRLSYYFGYLALASGSIWFGAYIARMLTTYQFFEETEFVLKSYINSTNLSAVIEALYPLVNLTFISYLIMITSFTLFLILSDIKLKENGWLFMTALIVFITLPFEFILLVIDYKLIILFLNEQFSSEKILELVIERVSKLSSFPIIQILSYLTIPYLLIFRPFTLKNKDEN